MASFLWALLVFACGGKYMFSCVLFGMNMAVQTSELHENSNLAGKKSFYFEFLELLMAQNKRQHILKIFCRSIRSIIQNSCLALAIYFSQIGGTSDFRVVSVIVFLFCLFPIKTTGFDSNLQFQNNYEKRTSQKIKKFMMKSKILTKYISIGFLIITAEKYYNLNWSRKQVIFCCDDQKTD